MPNLYTLSELAHATLRAQIVRGELPAGRWLRKRELAGRLNMSPTPVVDALRRLERDGLVENEPQWGTRVKTFTVDEIYQLAGMRIALEGLVARYATERLTADAIAAMRPRAAALDRVDATLSVLDAPDASERSVLDEEMLFHLGLADAANLPLVRREIERLRVLDATCRRWITPGIVTTVTHGQLLDAIATRDPHAAEAAMRLHIQDNVDAYLPALRARFGEGPINDQRNESVPRPRDE